MHRYWNWVVLFTQISALALGSCWSCESLDFRFSGYAVSQRVMSFCKTWQIVTRNAPMFQSPTIMRFLLNFIIIIFNYYDVTVVSLCSCYMLQLIAAHATRKATTTLQIPTRVVAVSTSEPPRCRLWNRTALTDSNLILTSVSVTGLMLWHAPLDARGMSQLPLFQKKVSLQTHY